MENAINLTGKSIKQIAEFIASMDRAKIKYSVFVAIIPETNGQLKKFDQLPIDFPEKKKIDKGPRRHYDNLSKVLRDSMQRGVSYLSRGLAESLYKMYGITGDWEKEKFNATVASCLINNESRYFEIDRSKGKPFYYKIKITQNENAY